MAEVTELVAGYGPVVPFRVSFDGQTFSEEDVPFTYHEPIGLGYIDPLVGPSAGGTHVRVLLNATQSNLSAPYTFDVDSSDIMCSFNGTVVQAFNITNSSVTCHSPATRLQGGVVTVEVSVNNGMDFTSSGLQFIYLPDSTGLQLSPLLGPTTGNTLVTIYGEGIPMVPKNAVKCRFGSVEVSAYDSGLGFVQCRAPAKESPVTLPVEFSLNGRDYTSYGLQYSYEWPLHISELIPPYGPAEGGTRVKVLGGYFRNEISENLRCRFGDQDVPARYQSETEVGCTAPALRPIDEVQSASIYQLNHVPEVQTVVFNASDYVEEIFEVQTYSTAVMKDEIQLVETTVQNVAELQEISAGKLFLPFKEFHYMQFLHYLVNSILSFHDRVLFFAVILI